MRGIELVEIVSPEFLCFARHYGSPHEMCNEIAARRRYGVNRLHKEFRLYRFLVGDFVDIPLHHKNTNARKDGLKLLHLISTSRYASRGKSQTVLQDSTPVWQPCLGPSEFLGHVRHIATADNFEFTTFEQIPDASCGLSSGA